MRHFVTPCGLKQQKGLSLIEAIAWLGLFAIVIVGALALYASANSSQKSTQMVSDMASIREGVRQMQAGGGYGTAVLNDVLTRTKRLPSTMSINSTTTPDTITHSMNGTVTVTGQTSQFTISATNIPQDVCIAAVSAAGGSGWAGISVNGTAVTMPTTMAAASTACSAATNTVLYTAI